MILLAVAALVAALGKQVLSTAEAALLRSSEEKRSATAARIGAEVRRKLDEAGRAAEETASILRARAHGPELEALVFAELLGHERLAELSLTLDAPRVDTLQLSVARGLDGALSSRRVGADGRVEERRRAPGEGFEGAVWARTGTAPDPREHLTYATPASIEGEDLLWTDLAYAEVDANRPERERRVVVSALKRVTGIGVVRATLGTAGIDEIARGAVAPDDPHRVFLADDRGRLISRLRPDQPMIDRDDELRPSMDAVPEEIRAALGAELLARAVDEGESSGLIDASMRSYFVTFRALPESQDWLVGVLVPTAIYEAELEPVRARLFVFAAAILGALLVGGAIAVRTIDKNLGAFVARTEAMRRFDFAASPARASLADVREVLEGLERAKTALRALGKFVPIDLVRELYRDNKEPVLGGAMREVSIMFTDIADFTTVSERMSPDALAVALGDYLGAMTTAIRGAGGTIDKYIGDAVMALWNAPGDAPDHPAAACGAALACVEATARLYESAAWGDRPRFHTRFGLHRDHVIVGNFGAPERLSYTAIGDGVNLAARLEGLCKVYGVQIIVSEAMLAPGFVYRPLDRVAVKGRRGGVAIYELLGREVGPERRAELDRYARALEAYSAREFERAAALLADAERDGPSAVLRARCQAYAAEPPPPDWDGVHVLRSK